VTIEALTSDGTALEQAFVVSVVADQEAPYFSSLPVTRVMLGSTYSYHPIAEVGGAQIPVLLEVGPVGMTLDVNGELRWIPALGQTGDHPVSLVARSSSGETARQEFVVQVPSALRNKPPLFAPLSVPLAYAGVSFALELSATDP